MKQKSISLYDWCITNNREDLLKEWDYVYNIDKNPSSITFGSNVQMSITFFTGTVSSFFRSMVRSFFKHTVSRIFKGKVSSSFTS